MSRKVPLVTMYLENPKSYACMHIRVPNIRNRSNNNMVERLNGTVGERNKVMRGLKGKETASTIMDGQRVYYNFIRPHIALSGKTPAEKAGVQKSQKNRWMALIHKSAKK